MVQRLALIGAVLPLLAATPAPPDPAAILESLKFDAALTLLDAGRTPRQVVRYHPKPGSAVTFETVSRSKTDLTMTMPGGQPTAIPLGDAIPAMVMTTRNTVGEPVPNGLVPVRIEQLGARTEGPTSPEISAAMAGVMAPINGMTFEMWVDPATGRPIQLDIVGGDPQTADLMQQIADGIVDRVPTFPTEPIGNGAKWKVDFDLSMSGIQMIVGQTFTARKITADVVELDVVLDLRLGDGGIAVPGLPPGAVEIAGFAGSGHGSTRADLETLVGTGTLVMDVDLAMTVASPEEGAVGLAMKMTQTTETRLAK